MTDTYDNGRQTRNYGLEDVDRSFRDWWKKKLAINLKNKDGESVPVPIFFFSSERWSKSREDGETKESIAGMRDKNGTLILPLIAIIRSPPNSGNDGPYGRTFAETKGDITYSKQVHPKSSKIKNLLKSRPSNVDPNFPIYEVYTAPVPDHYQLTYEVKIWTQYVDQMNEIIEKIGQELDFKSERSFQFNTDDGYYFIAFQDDDWADESNLNEYSDEERIVRMTTTFSVGAHILPQSDQRENTLKRYWSQTKLVIKNETALSAEEFDKLIGKYD